MYVYFFHVFFLCIHKVFCSANLGSQGNMAACDVDGSFLLISRNLMTALLYCMGCMGGCFWVMNVAKYFGNGG